MDSEISEDEAFSIYWENVSENYNTYAREVDLEGLVGLYRVAFEQGRASLSHE